MKHINDQTLTQLQIAAKIASKHGITKKLAAEILEHIAALTQTQAINASPVSAVDAADEAAIAASEEKLKRKLKRSYEVAGNVAIKAFRSRKFPETPVILFGDDGFFFGDEMDQNGIPACADLREEFYNPECDPGDILPEWGDVYEYLSEFFNRGDDWKRVLKIAIKTGDYSKLLSST